MPAESAKPTWVIVVEWLTIVGLLGLGVFALRKPLGDMLHVGWNDEEQSHILLAPVVAAWLIVMSRDRLKGLRFRQNNIMGPIIVTIGWIMSGLGFRYGVMIAWHGGAVLVLIGLFLSVTGMQIFWRFPAAFGALAFTLPVPGFIRQKIALPLQRMAATVTEYSLDLMGIAATRTGSVLEINGEQVAVGEACNGMRMVFALTLIAYAFVFSVKLRPSVRIALLILSPVIALLCNVIRLIPTSLFFGYGTVERAEAFHDLAGWIMLPISLVMFFGVIRLLEWLELPIASQRPKLARL